MASGSFYLLIKSLILFWGYMRGNNFIFSPAKSKENIGERTSNPNCVNVITILFIIM